MLAIAFSPASSIPTPATRLHLLQLRQFCRDSWGALDYWLSIAEPHSHSQEYKFERWSFNTPFERKLSAPSTLANEGSPLNVSIACSTAFNSCANKWSFNTAL